MNIFASPKRPVNGVFVFVTSDPHLQQIWRSAIEKAGYDNKLLFLSEGKEVLSYLKSTIESIFMIVSEAELQGMDGIQLRRQLLTCSFPGIQTVPFFLFASNPGNALISAAYAMNIHGLFDKTEDISVNSRLFRHMVDLWADTVRLRMAY